MCRDLETHLQYHAYRLEELSRRADQERLAQIVQSTPRRARFYYPALARFGRWLMASGQRLQKRYGELCDLPASSSRPAHRNA